MNEQMIRSKQVYHSIIRRKIYWLFTGLLCLVALFIIDVMTGPAWLTVPEVFSALFSQGGVNSQNQVIVWVIRLPIACMALVVGAALGTAGAQMQTVLDNPLASPYTLGVSAAAAFGAALAIVCSHSLPFNEVFVIPLSAFLFAVISSLLVYFISRSKNGAVQTVILTGVALSFLFNSLVSLLQYVARENQFEAIVLWMFGSLQSATWLKVLIIASALVLALPAFMVDSWKLTALKLGDDKARSMGIRTDRLRLKVVIISSLLTAVSVSFVGSIGFIGLVAPHIARSFVGEDQRFFLPCSALFGAVILSFASIISKTLVPGAVFPVGITTSLIGIPFLLYIVLRKNVR